jgi:signal transduction histidine kinase
MQASSKSTLDDLTQRFFAYRFSAALVIAFALIAIVFNEASYRHTKNLLRDGVALTDARVASHRVLIAITEAETAQRGFLLTGDEKHLQVYRASLGSLGEPLQQVEAYFSTLNDPPMNTVTLSALVQAKLQELDEGITRRTSANPGPVLLEAEPGRPDLMASIREKMNRTLDHAMQSTIEIRAHLFRSIELRYLAIYLLIFLALTGVWLLFRQFQREQAEKVLQREVLRSQVETRTAELRNLARDMQNIREDERRHLARELHDELGGLLTTVKLDLARIKSHGAGDGWLQERLEKLNTRLNEGIAIKRRMIEALRPSALDNLGLHAALTILCRETGDAMGVPISHAIEEFELPPELSLTLYRFVQEALTNAGKHAKAQRLWVEVTHRDGWARAVVKDDGRGFDETQAKVGHHGLTGMRFRLESHGGDLFIRSSAGHGSELEARLPVKAQP